MKYGEVKTSERLPDVSDMIETYFKEWDGERFIKPTPLERQKFEACAESILQLLQHSAQSRYDEAMEYVKLQPYALHAFVMPVVKRVAEIASGLHIK